MALNENGGDGKEKLNLAGMSKEAIALKKFNQIFDDISGKGGYGPIEENGLRGYLTTEKSGEFSEISMEWKNNKGKVVQYYTLRYDSERKNFALESDRNKNGVPIQRYMDSEFVPNLTPDELDEIFPKFINRLKQAKRIEEKERQETLKRTSQYAQAQDIDDAENMMDEFLAA